MRLLPTLSLLTLALLACAGGSTETAPKEEAKPVSVTTSVATVAEVPRSLKVTGQLIALEDADVAAEAGGTVERIVADRGDTVAKGGALVEIDTTTSSLQAREAAASVASAEAQVRLAEAECGRARQLSAAGAMSDSERDRALTQCEQGARQLDAARARKALADANLARGTVRAPFGGVVADRLVSPGEYVNPGRAVLRLVATDPLRLEISVPERAAGQVAPGASVRFEVPERPGQSYTAVVDRVSPALRDKTRDLMVEATVPNPDQTLTPNSFALVFLSIPAERGVTIPKTAVHEGEIARVFVAKDGVAEERVVELGAELESTVEVRVGVAEGESVIAPIPEGLVDGSKLAGS